MLLEPVVEAALGAGVAQADPSARLVRRVVLDVALGGGPPADGAGAGGVPDLGQVPGNGGARGPGNSAWPGGLWLGYRPDMPGIVIVGAGFGGIGMGIALKKAGYHDFVILDKAHDLGTGS